MTIQVDILICGAGPVGLYFAYLMASQGHSIFLCDTKSGPTDQSRALLMSTRTLEILDSKGLAVDMLTESYIPSGTRVFSEGKLVGQMEACGDTPFPHMTIIPQGTTERVLYRRLTADTPCKVHWETELVSYKQEEHRVMSIVKHHQQETVVESKYIIGADGSHSKVRKTNQEWTYEGTALKTKFAIADLTVNTTTEDIQQFIHKTSVFMKGSKMMLFVRMIPSDPSKDGAQVFRVFGNLDSFEGADVERHDRVTHGLVDNKVQEAPTLEFMQAWVDEITSPQKYKLSDLIWSSYFKINERLANGFRRDRAFLIGDAAHCHSPAGGQGMNLGLQDADNLAWKLSQVLRGRIQDPNKLLDSYNEERYPQAKATVQMTGNGTRASIMDNVIVNTVRSAFLSTTLKIPYLKHYFFKIVLQQFISIDPKDSSILGVSDKGLIQAGHFLPDTCGLRKSICTQPAGRRRFERWTLRDLVSDSDTYAVVLVATCSSGSTPNTALIEHFWKATTGYPIKRFIIQSAWHAHFMRRFPEDDDHRAEAEAVFYTEEQMDLSHSVTQRIGLYPSVTPMFFVSETPSTTALLIVRPDMYVAQARLVTTETELLDSLHMIYSTFIKQ